MTKSNSTKKALVFALLSTLLCVSMLIGTTFAWFTDTASTAVNKIQAGNLKVELEYSYDLEEWKTATSETKLFDDNTLWEPGVTVYVYLRVKNAGNLAMQYTVLVNPYVQSSRGKNVNNEFFYIRDYLKAGFASVDSAFATRKDAQAAIAENAKTITSTTPFEGETVLPGNYSDPMALVIYLPEEVGNEANAKSTSWLSYIYNLGVNVYASQASYESDSNGNTYDEKAPVLLKPESYSYGKHEITQNIQASGRYGVVQAAKTAQFIINADVYAEYGQSASGETGAMAVWAGDNSKIIINGGDFRQVGVPADDPCDLIYATGHAVIEINGGTFKAVNPDRTLNVLDADRGNAQIIVKGGSFYKYDPSHPTLGDNEVVIPEGYKVVQSGDWYTVVAE